MTKNQAVESLKNFINPGDTLIIAFCDQSASGMSRRYRVILTGDKTIYDVEPLIAKACGLRMGKNQTGIRVNGCGMDMTWWLIECISYQLFGSSGKLNRIAV